MFYKIIYWNTSYTLTSNSSEALIVLSDLKKYSKYQVIVSGYTVHGDGNQSSEILQITTMEDGKLLPSIVTSLPKSKIDLYKDRGDAVYECHRAHFSYLIQFSC